MLTIAGPLSSYQTRYYLKAVDTCYPIQIQTQRSAERISNYLQTAIQILDWFDWKSFTGQDEWSDDSSGGFLRGGCCQGKETDVCQGALKMQGMWRACKVSSYFDPIYHQYHNVSKGSPWQDRNWKMHVGGCRQFRKCGHRRRISTVTGVAGCREE